MGLQHRADAIGPDGERRRRRLAGGRNVLGMVQSGRRDPKLADAPQSFADLGQSGDDQIFDDRLDLAVRQFRRDAQSPGVGRLSPRER
jgi:hypothetical protein